MCGGEVTFGDLGLFEHRHNRTTTAEMKFRKQQ